MFYATDDSVIIITAYCPAETTDLLRGNYTWSEKEAEITQTIPCEFNGTGSGGECDIVPANASRTCNDEGQWNAPDVSNCVSEVTAILCSIRNVSTHSLAVSFCVCVWEWMHTHTSYHESKNFVYICMFVHVGSIQTLPVR